MWYADLNMQYLPIIIGWVDVDWGTYLIFKCIYVFAGVSPQRVFPPALLGISIREATVITAVLMTSLVYVGVALSKARLNLLLYLQII